YFPCPWATYYPCLGSHHRHRRPFGLGASAALPWMAFHHHHQACLAYPAFVACHRRGWYCVAFYACHFCPCGPSASSSSPNELRRPCRIGQPSWSSSSLLH